MNYMHVCACVCERERETNILQWHEYIVHIHPLLIITFIVWHIRILRWVCGIPWKGTSVGCSGWVGGGGGIAYIEGPAI